jgi:membrane protease YdiL (CAAX protease family)
MLLALSIFPFIIGYAWIMYKSGVIVRRSHPQIDWLLIFKVALPVAVIEEFIFRFVIMGMLSKYIGLEYSILVTSIFFSLTHFWWGMYSRGTEYGKDWYVGIGLFFLALTLSVFYFTPFANIAFHAMCIYAVEINSDVYYSEDEVSWNLFDEGHQLLRSPLIWVVLIVYAILAGGVL